VAVDKAVWMAINPDYRIAEVLFDLLRHRPTIFLMQQIIAGRPSDREAVQNGCLRTTLAFSILYSDPLAIQDQRNGPCCGWNGIRLDEQGLGRVGRAKRLQDGGQDMTERDAPLRGPLQVTARWMGPPPVRLGLAAKLGPTQHLRCEVQSKLPA